MIEGILYKVRSSKSEKVILLISGNLFYIKTEDTILSKGDITTLVVSSRLGNIERKITLKDGSVFATKDNEAVDKLLLETTKKRSILHRLETNSFLIVASIFFVVLFSFAFLKWGVPSISKKIAHALPNEVNSVISENTLELFDNYIFKPSKLSSSRKDEIETTFKQHLLPLIQKEEGMSYKVHFRLFQEGEESIANAFALPNGDIILTDKFVQLSHNQNEISSVILHEMGHVKERHGLQRLIQSSFIAVTIMFVSGDSTTLVDMGIGLGTLFLTSNYSRDHELEADLFAFKKMLVAKIDPDNFVNIMSRLSNSTPTKNNKEKNIIDYISSHPDTKYRLEIAMQYSQCFKEGLSKCEINKHLF